MNALHVIWSGNFGGIEKLVLDLCAAQKNNPELEIELMIAKGDAGNPAGLAGENIVHHFPGLKNGFDFSLSRYREIKKTFEGFDVIHLHFYNPLIALAATRSGKKIIYSEHGNFGFGKKRKLSDGVKTFFMKKFLNNNVSFISFNSEFTKQVATQRYGLHDKNCAVVLNGINFSDLQETYSPDTDLQRRLSGKFTIGTASRFAGVKRIDRLIKAFAGFQKDKETVLLLAGDGILRKELEQLVQQQGISGRTIFTGYRKDVRQIQEMVDVCVVPSQNEAFGLVAIEVLALGKPVIVFEDGGGVADIIRKISEPDVVQDIESLVKRLEYYYHHRNEMLEGKEGRIRFAKSFDIKVMEEKFFNIYKSIS